MKQATKETISIMSFGALLVIAGWVLVYHFLHWWAVDGVNMLEAWRWL